MYQKTTIKEYEDLLNNSPVLDMVYDEQSETWRAEYYKFLELLYNYVSMKYRNGENYSVEIVETCQRCLGGYSRERGAFVNFFNFSFSKVKHEAETKEYDANVTSNIKTGKKDKEIRKKIIAFLNTHNDLELRDLFDRAAEYAEVFGVSEETLKDAVLLHQNAEAIRADASISAAENLTVFDAIADPKETPEEHYARNDYLLSCMETINEKYLTARKGSKELLSVMLTNLVMSYNLDSFVFEKIVNFDFFNKDIGYAIQKRGSPLKQIDIAKHFGKSNANASQIFRHFLDSVTREIGR